MGHAGADKKGNKAPRSAAPRSPWIGSTSSTSRSRISATVMAVLFLSLSMLADRAAGGETLAAGGDHVCVITAETVPGGVKCWGLNSKGQLGYQDVIKRGADAATLGEALDYVDLGDGRTAVSITAGDAHTCAVLDDGSLKVLFKTPNKTKVEKSSLERD